MQGMQATLQTKPEWTQADLENDNLKCLIQSLEFVLSICKS